MRILLVNTSIFKLTPQGTEGYAGIEYLACKLAAGLASRGHVVTLVSPEGSDVGVENIEYIYTPLREEEEKSWARYRGRLEQGEWEVILDTSWQKWAMMSSIGRDPQLPIVNWWHSHHSIIQAQPSVQYPMWVGISRGHAEELTRAWGVATRWVYNGIDTDFYKASGQPRGGRWLALGRWTPEKGFLEMSLLAKKLRIGLDLYGDQEIIGSDAYMRRAMAEADGIFVRAHGGVSREKTVELYSKGHGLLHLHRWEEPMGLVPIEAMACGAVPIAMKRGGPAETIRHGVTGFLVDTDEEAAELIKRDAIKEISPEAMRAHVEEHFSLKRFIDDWADLLQKVAAGERW